MKQEDLNAHSFLCLQICMSYTMLRRVPHAESSKEIKVTFSSPIWTCQIIREERKVSTANCYSLCCLKDGVWVANSYCLKVGRKEKKRKEIYGTSSWGGWAALYHTMEKTEKVQQRPPEAFLKQSLQYTTLGVGGGVVEAKNADGWHLKICAEVCHSQRWYEWNSFLRLSELSSGSQFSVF